MEEEDGDHLYTVKGRRQGRRTRGRKITRYKYNKGKESLLTLRIFQNRMNILTFYGMNNF